MKNCPQKLLIIVFSVLPTDTKPAKISYSVPQSLNTMAMPCDLGRSCAKIYGSSVGLLENTNMSTQPIFHLYSKKSKQNKYPSMFFWWGPVMFHKNGSLQNLIIMTYSQSHKQTFPIKNAFILQKQSNIGFCLKINLLKEKCYIL